MNLLIKFPTRGRPEKFLETLRMYSEKLSGKHDVVILVIIDADDDTMMAPDIRRQIDVVPHVVVQVGTHKNKVEAINDSVMADMIKWDVLLLASDDMIPQVDGYDDIICSRMKKNFPNMDGILWCNDGYAEDRLNTLCIIGRRYYENFQYIYHPDYKSLWCDNEFMEVSQASGLYAYFPDCIIKHEHWANNKDIKKDRRAIETESFYAEDEATYRRRKADSFGVRLLSILICTVPERAELFGAMMVNLNDQIKSGGFRESVEIIMEMDGGAMTIGEKRNKLLDRARGAYVAYVDDDDFVSEDYIVKILGAIRESMPDCVGFEGLVYMATQPERSYKRFIHSIKYTTQGETPEFFYRPPNHLNPIRRSIALRYRFPLLDHGEDTEYSLAIAASGELRTEVMVDGPLYYYIPSWMRERGMVSGVERP